MNDRDRERALRQDLRELARMQPDPEAAARAIERARAATGSTTAHPSLRRRNIMSLRNIAAAAAVFVAMALLRHWLTPAGASDSFAFGAVQQQVEKMKSVRYCQTRKDRTKEGKTLQAENRKVKILGPHQMWEEVEMDKSGDPVLEGSINLSAGPEKYIMVHNLKTGKMISLYPDKKGYIVPLVTLGIDLDSGEVKEEKIEATPEVDFYKRIRKVPPDKAKKLPDRTIDGKVAAGFQVVEKIERPTGTDTWTRTYWIHPEAKLPVRIETLFESSHPMTGRSEWVQSDIVFDEPLDEGLFSTDPPKGYKDLEPEELRRDDIEKSKKRAAGKDAK